MEGLDGSGFDDSFVSFQLFKNWLFHGPVGFIRDRLETRATLTVDHRDLQERLRIAAAWLVGSEGDGLFRLEIRYDLNADLTVWGGTDVFHGDANSLFDQFGSEDRAVMGLGWHF